jgi:hypothetical protein
VRKAPTNEANMSKKGDSVSITGSVRKAPTNALEVLLSPPVFIWWQTLRPGPQLTSSVVYICLWSGRDSDKGHA